MTKKYLILEAALGYDGECYLNSDLDGSTPIALFPTKEKATLAQELLELEKFKKIVTAESFHAWMLFWPNAIVQQSKEELLNAFISE